MIKKFFPQAVMFVTLIGIPFLYVTPAAYAQEPAKSGSGASTTVSDKDLSAFARAYVEYHKIRQSYEPSLEKAQDPKEKETIAAEANSKVKKAIEKNGLSADKYNKIFTAVNNNEQLRKRALKLIDQERKRS